MMNPFKEQTDEVLAEIEALKANQEALQQTPGTEGARRMIQDTIDLLHEELAHLDIATQDAHEIAEEIADHEELLWELQYVPGEREACQEIRRTLTALRERLHQLTGGKTDEP